MKQFVYLALIAVTSAALNANQNAQAASDAVTADHGDKWNYIKHGSDWGGIAGYEACAEKEMQSPINLISKGSANFEYKIVAPEKDKLEEGYSNQSPGVVVFNGHTTQVNLDVSGYATKPPVGANGFTSSIPKEFWETKVPMQFNAQSFNFHAKSEHTIDGERRDLEMQTVHFNAETDHKHGFPDAVVSILFSVEEFDAKLNLEQTAIIDNFFDSIDFSKDVATEKTWSSSAIAYGNLMNLVDWNNRWVYKGSVTTPPCETQVYWNVIAQTFPIRQKNLDKFQTQLAKATGYETDKELDKVGNYREIAKENGQDVMYVFKPREATANEEKEKNTVLIIVIGVLGFLTFAFCVTTVAFYTKANAASKISGSNEGGEMELEGGDDKDSTRQKIVFA